MTPTCTSVLKNGHAPNPDYVRRAQDSFRRQTFMATLAAALQIRGPGSVAIRVPARGCALEAGDRFADGVVGTVADNAGGYAAYTLLPADWSILTAEFKVNFLVPALGCTLTGESRVVSVRDTVIVCQSEVVAGPAGRAVCCATALVTLMALPGRADHATRAPVR